MLRYLRENTGNWIIKIFLGIIVVVFVFLGVGSFGSKPNNSIGSINEEPITIKEYQEAYKAIVNQLRIQFGDNLNDDILKALNVKQQAINAVIEQKLILLEADKMKISVSDKELQQSLLSIKAFQKDGQFNLEQYRKVLSLNALNPEIFEANQINSLRQGKVRSLVLSAVNVSDLEAKNWYLFQNTKTAVDYRRFNPADYSDIRPDEEQIKAFYAENNNQYKSEPKVKAVYLKFSPEDYVDKVSVSQEKIKDYYEQNPEKFKTPEKVEASHILIKVAEDAKEEDVKAAEKRALDVYDKASKGEDFAVLAKEYSEGPSKESGGFLGTFEKKSMVKPFADAAFALNAGEISKPVRTMFGWHVIKVSAKFDASTQTLVQAAEKIKAELDQQERQNLAYDKSGEAFDAVIDGDDFEQVALIAGKKVTATQAFSIKGEGLEIADSEGFARAAFELAVDDISDVKQLGDAYYLIRVVEKIEPVVQELDQVREQVVQDLTASLQRDKAKADALLLVKEAVDAGNLDELIKAHPDQYKSTDLFTRNGSIKGIADASELIKAGFSLNENKKVYPEIIETSAGFYVIGFKQRKFPEDTEIAENLKTVKNEISYRKQADSFQAWMTELRKQYEINLNPEILN